MKQPPIALRVTRDYVNIARDKRHSSGWHGLPVIPAGSFIVWVPAYTRISSNGAPKNAGNTMRVHINDKSADVRVPPEFISSLNPHAMNAYTAPTEPATHAEMHLYLNQINVDGYEVLKQLLVSKQINMAQLHDACEQALTAATRDDDQNETSQRSDSDRMRH